MSGEIHIKLEHKTPDKSKPGVLMVQVVKARNLAPKGLNGLANPFLRLNFGKRRKKTKIISKSLDPTFNEVFEFKATEPVPKELVITVWHQDVLKNVFMGQVSRGTQCIAIAPRVLI
jgi:Ca2+-dependent lipid-binding protein